MATQGGLIRDQNLNVHFDVAPLGVKTNASKAQKNGGLGGRRALNDISNSGRPSTLQNSKRHNSKNVISAGEDIGPSKPISSFGGKRNASKAPEKVQAGGRKALSDLTNSGKPHVNQVSKKSQGNKMSAVSEEQFLHNHQECIKAKARAVDIDQFLKTIGLENDNSMQLPSPRVSPLSRKWKADSPPRYMEIDEMSEFMYEDHYEWKKTEYTPCISPKSPKPCVQWKEDPNFMLTGSPKLQKH